MMWHVCTLLWAVGVGTVLARVCYMGNEPDWSGKMRWVLPYRDPCNCTEIRIGGLNTQAPRRSFLPTYLDSLVITKDPEEIRKLLNCTSTLRKLVCENENDPLSISCGSNSVIDVKWALYGREDGNPNCKVGNVSPCGNATSSLSKVQEGCQGEHKCNIPVTNSHFGVDPCQSVGKYLVVHYVCSAEAK